MQDKTTDRELVPGLIARLEDAPPPEHLCAAIMARIQAKRPSRWQRLGRRLYAPLAVVTLRPLPAVIAAFVLIGLVFMAKAFWMPSFPLLQAPFPDGRHSPPVTFMLDWPSAQKVAVIGSFNHWRPTGFEMRRNPANGVWQLSVPLAKGRHAYAFIIDDEQVIADPRSLWVQEDGFGGHNSLMTVDNGNAHEKSI